MLLHPARSTIQALSRTELASDGVIEQIKSLDRSIRDAIESLPLQDAPRELQDVDDDDYTPYIPMDPEMNKPEADDFSPEECDNLISAEVLLPKEDVLVPAIIVSRKKNSDGRPIGNSHTNPILDTRIYMSSSVTGTLRNMQLT